MNRLSGIILGLFLTGFSAESPSVVDGADWPAWRFDAGRGSATTEQLAKELHPQWTLELPPLKPAWPA